MLFMLIVKASHNSEGVNLPSPELNEAMSKFNEELVKAGVRLRLRDFIQAQMESVFRFRNQGKSQWLQMARLRKRKN